MALPFQNIVACARTTSEGSGWTLIGASGPGLVVQSSNGATSVWPAVGIDETVSAPVDDDEAEEPPGKRIKLSPSTNKLSNFACLTVSNDGDHLVAVTTGDKCIRVFRIDSDSQLHQLSQRCMVRRPCAIALTPDDSTILCADKFGDVYALPLHPPPDDGQNGAAVIEQDEAATQKPFVPAASVLTVHSGRNRKVLEEQVKQAQKGQMKSKEAITFKHDLLLGHVSMLTDIAYTRVEGRSYIITADRDEHIRISRGPPQAHIIEGFCQGHDEFVSRLCFTQSGLLVSAGGDPYVFVWDWLYYRLLQRVCIRDAVLEHLISQPQLASTLPEDKNFKIAVSGIWSVPNNTEEKDSILVACEGVPALLHIKVDTAGSSTCVETVPLSGNALDVTFVCAGGGLTWTAVVSVDHVHVPGSTTAIRGDYGPFRLQCLSYQDSGRWEEDKSLEAGLEWFSRGAPADQTEQARRVEAQAVRDMVLYSVENLRKRPGAEE